MDHSTVCYGCKNIAAAMGKNKQYMENVMALAGTSKILDKTPYLVAVEVDCEPTPRQLSGKELKAQQKAERERKRRLERMTYEDDDFDEMADLDAKVAAAYAV